MKSSHILTLGISSTLLATGFYLSYPDSPSEHITPSPNHQPNTASIVMNSQQSMWEILDEATKRAEAMKQSIPSDRDQLIALVDQNLTLKMRIQGMSWYRDFLLGKLQVEDIKKDIIDASLLEDTLKADPSLLIRIQNRDIWRQYLSGAVPPNNLIYGELPAMLSVDRFAQENPAIYAQIQKNPMFSA